MFDAMVEAMDAGAAFAEAAACRRIAEAAEARLLQVAAHVAEFAPAELGAALAITTPAAAALIGEALELRHRLPRTWARVHTGQLPAWRARLLARRTMTLAPRVADQVDAEVAHLDTLTSYRAQQVIDAALVRHDPDRAAQLARAAAQSRGVRLRRGHHDRVVHLDLDLDAPDAAAFDAAVAQIATLLAHHDHTDDADAPPEPLQVRRARAVGILADPQHALTLQAADATGPAAADGTPPRRGGGRAGARVGRGASSIVLHVHLFETTLTHGTGVARVEALGPLTTDAVARWLHHRHAAVRPVLHPGTTTGKPVAVDCYEIPDHLREAVLAALPYCVFPWCNHPSRTADLDHTQPYADPDTGGPPGQTRADNLGPLCRRHHRLKTHSDWQVHQPQPGVFLWTSPHGTRYRVDHHGTTLDDAA